MIDLAVFAIATAGGGALLALPATLVLLAQKATKKGSDSE